MIYTTISSRQMLTKVYNDFSPPDGGWVTKGIEWIGDALQAMDISPIHEKKSTVLTIEGHRAKLPCNLRAIRGVEYGGFRLPYGGDLTGYSLVQKEGRTTEFSPRGESLSNVYQATGQTDSLGGNIEIVASSSIDSGEYYQVNPDYLITSFEEGEVRVHYDAFPVDNDNLPVIPDVYSVKEAILWYIISRMLMSGYKHPEFNFVFADGQWKDYKDRAMNDAMWPSIDKMDTFRRMWVRMGDPTWLPDQFFMNSEQSENIRMGDNYHS